MPFEIRPLEDADVPRFVALSTAALGTSGIGIAMHGEHPLPAYLKIREQRVRKAMQTKPWARHLKVVDTDKDDEIVAGAVWDFYENGRSDEQLAELDKPWEPIEEERERYGQAQKDFFAYICRARRELGKTPQYMLDLLVVHPDHHRRGAGSLLIRWGTEQADKAGLLCSVEASEMGYPLYKRHGFVERYCEITDLSKYGRPGVDRNYPMLRQPVRN